MLLLLTTLTLNATTQPASPTSTQAGPWAAPWALDLLLIPPLALLSLFITLPALLSLFAHKPGRSHRLSTDPPPAAYVVSALTRHARFLPRTSKHRFRYNTLYLATRLDHLERHALDTGHAFAWRGSHYDPDASQTGQHDQEQPQASLNRTRNAGLEECKVSIRRSEERERRAKQEKRRKVRATTWATTWAITALHPDSFLRNDFALAPNDAVPPHYAQSASRPASSAATKADWLKGSILLKLAYELRERGYLTHGPQDEIGFAATEPKWSHQLRQVWTVTMPAVFGLKGINPLTVHYCYRPSNHVAVAQPSSPGNAAPAHGGADGARGDFWLVVLEVHNTFGERHVYILESGVAEDKLDGSLSYSPDVAARSAPKRDGYDHQWTFPRSFHVSPFNDRGGYYRLFLREPFSDGTTAVPFVLAIRLLLLVEADGEGDSVPASDPAVPARLEKKLMASLESYPPAHDRRVLPLTALHLYMALLRQPLDLFLTFGRILLQAGKLHFAKKLDAFGRPDMVQTWQEPGSSSAEEWDGRGLPPPINRIQPHRTRVADNAKSQDLALATKPTGGLVYPAHTTAETIAKRQLEQFARKRVAQLHDQESEATWSFRVVSADPADAGIVIAPVNAEVESEHTQKELVLYTRSGSLYTDLLQFGDSRIARLVGSLVGRRWGVSDVELFERFFDVDRDTTSDSKGGWRVRWTNKFRRWHLFWLLGRTIASDPTVGRNVSEAEQTMHKALPERGAIGHSSPLDGEAPSFAVISTVALAYILAVAEERAFHYLGARYVRGTEPWLELERGIKLLRNGRAQAPAWNTRLGSARRD